MGVEKYITIARLAELLGISRIAVYKRVKKGQIPAIRIGRAYLITDKVVNEILNKRLTKQDKRLIESAVQKTVREYGEVLRKLGREE